MAIAQRKQAELAAAISAEWHLPAHLIPEGMLSPAESITEGPKRYGRVNVVDIPRTCGLLSSEELKITEKYDVRGLVAAMTEEKLKAEDVVRAFCKVRYSVGPLRRQRHVTYLELFRERPSPTNSLAV